MAPSSSSASCPTSPTTLYFQPYIDDVQVVARRHAKTNKLIPSHCRRCCVALLFHAVRNCHLKYAEDLCRAAAKFKGRASELHKAFAAAVSLALNLKDCPAMAQLLLQHMSACFPGEWEKWDGAEAHLLHLAVQVR